MTTDNEFLSFITWNLHEFTKRFYYREKEIAQLNNFLKEKLCLKQMRIKKLVIEITKKN